MLKATVHDSSNLKYSSVARWAARRCRVQRSGLGKCHTTWKWTCATRTSVLTRVAGDGRGVPGVFRRDYLPFFVVQIIINMGDVEQEECLGRVLAYTYSAISHSLRDGENFGKSIKNALNASVPKTDSFQTSTIHVTTEEGLINVVGDYVKDASLQYLLILTLGEKVGIPGHWVGLYLFRHMGNVFIWYRNPNGYHSDQCEYHGVFTLGQDKNVHPMVVLRRTYNKANHTFKDISRVFIIDESEDMVYAGPQMRCENLSRDNNKLEEITKKLGEGSLGSCCAWQAMYTVDLEEMLKSLPETSTTEAEFVSRLNRIEEQHRHKSSLKDISKFAYTKWNSEGRASLEILTEIYGLIDEATVDMNAYSDAFDAFEEALNKPRSLNTIQDIDLLKVFLTSTKITSKPIKRLISDEKVTFFLQRCCAFKTGITFSKYIVYAVMVLAACKVRHHEEKNNPAKRARLN